MPPEPPPATPTPPPDLDAPAEAGDAPLRRPGRIPRALLDEHAVSVVRRLQRHGHEAYLVGGCVRDLLAGLEPKDFDVATDATPSRIKRLFSNARIIGRRFRLAHIRFGPDHVVETSTFRGPPDPTERGRRADPPSHASDDQATEQHERPRGRRDRQGFPENVFGTAPTDARRRDFTINALFYDPMRDEILDYVGGLQDLEDRVIRSIGDPGARICEDPVRMIRAVHFAERLGFRLEGDLERAVRAHAAEMEGASQARLYVELLKVLGRGAAHATLRRLHDLGVLGFWTPEVASFLETEATWPAAGGGSHDEARAGEPEEIPVAHATWNLLGAADRWGPSAHDAEDALRLAPLVGPWLLEAWRQVPQRGFPAFSDVFDQTFATMARRMSIPRRVGARLKELLWLWLSLRHPPDGRRSLRVVHRGAFPLALAFLRLDLDARDRPSDLVDAWAAFAGEHGVSLEPRTEPGRPAPAGRRPRNRGGHAGRRETANARRRRGRGGRRHGSGGISSEASAWAPAPPPPDA